MASAVVELNQQNDSSLSSKSTRLHTAVDSAPLLNLSDENNEVARKCNHFSIRGYVSEVRKRDPQLCYPFTLKDSIDPRHELPPMVVPNFRWWRCISCVPEAKNVLQEDSRGAGKEEAQNDVNAEAPTILVGQSSKVNNAASVRNTEASTSSDSNDNKNFPPVFTDQKEKGKTHVNEPIPTNSGCENGFLNVSPSQRMPQQTLGQIIQVDPSADNEVTIRSHFNQNGTTNALHKDCRVGKTEVGLFEGYVTREGDYNTETCRGDPETSSQHQRAVLPTDAVAGIVNLPDLNECTGEPLNEVNNKARVTGNNIINFCEDDDDYLGAERRKKPKVRLLSELLGLKETPNPSKGKKKSLSSANSQDEYVKRKKVGTQDEGLKSKEIRVTNDGSKKIVKSSETSNTGYMSDSDDLSTEKISKTLAKRRCNSRDPLFDKRNKKVKLDHGESSSSYRQKLKTKSCHEKVKSSEELPQNLDFFPRLSEKNSVLTKKRGRVSQAQKVPTSLISSKSRAPKECRAIKKDGETEKNAAENVRNTSENGHYFLSSYLNKENDHLCIPRKDKLSLSSSQAEQTLIADKSLQKSKENGNIGETSATFRPTAAGAPKVGSQSDGDRSTCLTENSIEKKTGTPVADGCNPLAQHVPMQVTTSSSNQKELTNEVRGRIQDIDINSIPTDDKTNEQGPGDDIPMDIVELMAKNQYERHLDDPKDKHVISVPPDLSGTIVRPNVTNIPYGQHVQNIAQPYFLGMKKPPSADPKTSMFNENLGQYAYYNTNHPGLRSGFPSENPVSNGFLSPGHSQEHIRPFSAHGLTPNNWNGNLKAALSQQYPPNFHHTVDSFQKHRAISPRPSNTDHHHFWAPGMTSRMPLGITNPQMILRPDCLKGRFIHHQTSGSFRLNFPEDQILMPDILKKGRNLSNAFNGRNPESSATNLDDRILMPDILKKGRTISNAFNSRNPESSATNLDDRILMPDILKKGRTISNAFNGRNPESSATNLDDRLLMPDILKKGRTISNAVNGRNPESFALNLDDRILMPDILKKGRNMLNAFNGRNPESSATNLDDQILMPDILKKGRNISNAFNGTNPESSARSVDFSEAIPAMHLLSLMQNAAKPQNTELSLGPQKVVSPTSSRFPFSKNNCRTNAMQDNSSPTCYSTAFPPVRPFPLAYQNDSAKKSAGFMGHIPLTLQGQRNMESSHFPLSSGDHRPLRRPLAPQLPRDRRKGIALPSKPPYINKPVVAMKDSPPNFKCGVGLGEKTVSPAPDKVICQLNQNPSEFNDLRLIAQFVIGPDDLKPRKTAHDRAPRPRGNSKRQNIKVNKPITPAVKISRESEYILMRNFQEFESHLSINKVEEEFHEGREL